MKDKRVSKQKTFKSIISTSGCTNDMRNMYDCEYPRININMNINMNVNINTNTNTNINKHRYRDISIHISYHYIIISVLTVLSKYCINTPFMNDSSYFCPNVQSCLWVEPLAEDNGKKTGIFGCQWIPLVGKASTNLNSNFHNVLPLHNKPVSLGPHFLGKRTHQASKRPCKGERKVQKRQSSFSSPVSIIFKGHHVKTSPPSWHLRLVS